MGGGSYAIPRASRRTHTNIGNGRRGRRAVLRPDAADFACAEGPVGIVPRRDKSSTGATQPKRKMSSAGRAAISAALKARWAAAKAANRNSL